MISPILALQGVQKILVLKCIQRLDYLVVGDGILQMKIVLRDILKKRLTDILLFILFYLFDVKVLLVEVLLVEVILVEVILVDVILAYNAVLTFSAILIANDI